MIRVAECDKTHDDNAGIREEENFPEIFCRFIYPCKSEYVHKIQIQSGEIMKAIADVKAEVSIRLGIGRDSKDEIGAECKNEKRCNARYAFMPECAIENKATSENIDMDDRRNKTREDHPKKIEPRKQNRARANKNEGSNLLPIFFHRRHRQRSEKSRESQACQ